MRDTVIPLVQSAAVPLTDEPASLDSLLHAAEDARLMLIGEASHGTHEFYQTRARLTQQLIEQHHFTAVIVEADWPDAYRVNRYVRGTADDASADAALGGFERFPQWMWRNYDVLEFVEWLRCHNAAASHACGFYGMDLYSLRASMSAVLDYLDRVDPAAAQRARCRYGCFDQFEQDPEAYGQAAGFELSETCEQQAVAQLVDLQRRAADLAKRDGLVAEDEFFFAEQNARLVKNAEQYYRQMFAGRADTWNLRDTHMTDTIEALLTHLDRTRGTRTRAVVWAHNSHLGDARHTQMGKHGGEVNVGQLCRERFGHENVFNIGFTTHTGAVAAAHNWGSRVRTIAVNPSLAESYEHLLHQAKIPQFSLVFKSHRALASVLNPERLERAIGVIYRPRTERISHYFHASLPKQFDAIIHIDTTTPVVPLETTAPLELEKAETFPTGV